MSRSAKILFHPTLRVSRAAEIARSQQAVKIERDACGRPFIMPSSDPLAEPEAPEPRFAERWERLIQAIRALIPAARQARPPFRREARGP